MNRRLIPVLVLWMVPLVGIWVAGVVLTSPARDARPPEPTFAEFLGELEQGELREVVLRTRDNSVRVAPANRPAYEILDWLSRARGSSCDAVELIRSARAGALADAGGLDWSG